MQLKDLQLKRALRAALMVLLLGVVGMTKGYAERIGDLNYSLNRTTLTATVTGHKNGTNATGSLVIPSSVTYTDYVYNSSTHQYDIPVTRTYSVTSIGFGAFSGCSGFTGSLTIGNSVTSIGDGAFYDCSGFSGNLVIPNSVTSIGDYAFRDCSGFTGNLTIPNSVTTIGDYAFRDCSGFTGSLTIGNSVTTIGDYAFRDCSGFTGSLTIGNSVTSIGDGAFYDCSGFSGNLVIPNSVTSIGDGAFYDCSGFSGNLVIPNSVTTIGSYDYLYNDYGAFSGCSGFTGSLTIPNSVTTIGGAAFSRCSGFTGSLTIPNSVTSIGNYAFSDCSGFTGSLIIPNFVTTIGGAAFAGCSGFTGSLIIPNSVTTIGGAAFAGCSGFTGSLIIPNSVTEIGAGVFSGCSGFTEFHYNATNAMCSDDYWVDPIFGGCNNMMVFVIGENVESLPNYSLFVNFASHELDKLPFIKSNAVVPPTVSISTFAYIDRDIPIIVPCGSVEAYQAAPYWSDFTDIRESEYALGVKANPDYLGSVIIVQEPQCNNSHCSVKAIPNPGCRFVNWTCNGEEISRNQNYSFDIEENMVLVANFETHKRFVGTVSWIWLDADNWEPAGVPDDTMSVVLQSNIVIDSDVTVGSVYNDGNYVMTIMPGATLTVMDNLKSQNISSRIIIEDGGQLVHPNDDAYATVKKTTKLQDDTSDNWAFIAYPLTGSRYIYGDMLSNQYDLYYYDEPAQSWNNYRQSDNNFNYLEAGKGYLYANSGTMETSPNGIQVGQGSSTTSYFPFYSYYCYSISESLFRANELAAAGLDTMPLGAICWYATNAPGYEQSNISIWMANVSDNELTSTSHLTSDMTLVYSGSMTPIMGWNEFAFNEGNFAWDGTSNVLICVQRNNGEWNSTVNWQSHETIFAAMTYSYTDNAAYDITSQTYSMSTSSTRPNIIFETAGHLGESVYHPVTLSFAGQLQNGTAPVSIPLSYTEGIDHPGYNLVGNPFVHNVTSYASENVAEGCFRMNETQDEIIVSEINAAHPLKPVEGFFVKAMGEGASITFNPSGMKGEAKAIEPGIPEATRRVEMPTITLNLSENGKLVDRLIMKKDGEPLEKLSLKKGSTKLYANDGQREMALVPIKGNEQAISFKAAHDGMYTLTVEVDGMEMGYLHLIDNVTGEDIDLLANKVPELAVPEAPRRVEGPTLNDGVSTSSTTSYSFNAKTTDDVSRFRLVFSICGDADGDNGRMK